MSKYLIVNAEKKVGDGGSGKLELNASQCAEAQSLVDFIKVLIYTEGSIAGCFKKNQCE
jgi:hypothetical protein